MSLSTPVKLELVGDFVRVARPVAWVIVVRAN